MDYQVDLAGLDRYWNERGDGDRADRSVGKGIAIGRSGRAIVGSFVAVVAVVAVVVVSVAVDTPMR